MFRPYNLTSLTAWTVGRLAGNHAYYNAKKRSQSVKITNSSCPRTVRALINKLENIEKQLVSFPAAIRNATESKGFNVTKFIQLFAYNDWLQIHKDRIKAEIKITYEASMADGYIWSLTVIQDLQANVDQLTENFQNAVITFREWLFDPARLPEPSGRQWLVNEMNKRQSLCYVDESTYKLVDTNENRLILR